MKCKDMDIMDKTLYYLFTYGCAYIDLCKWNPIDMHSTPHNTKDKSSLLCIVKFIIGNSNSNTHLGEGRRDAQLT